MADPLSQLRQFHINNREIKEYNGFIIFGDHGWPKTVNTNYQIYSSDEDKSKKEYYTLECLWNFLKHQDLAHTHYVKQGGTDNVPVVHRPDRKGLLAYLKGETLSSPSIDKNAPIPALRLPVSEIYKKTSDQIPPSNDQSSNSSLANEPGPSGSVRQNDTNGRPAIKRLHPEEEKKCREQLAARLDEPSRKKMATVITTESADKVSETAQDSAAINQFGAEKLAAIRAKRMAVKRTTIIDADMDLGKSGSGATDSVNKDTDLLIAMDSDPSKLIKSKEKIWRTRSSILQAQSKDFLKTLNPLINLLLKMENPKAHISGPINPTASNDLPSNPYHQNPAHHPQNPQAINQKNAYNRYDQERFVKLDIGVEIDTKKSFVSGVSNGHNQTTQSSKPTSHINQSGIPAISHPSQPHIRSSDAMDGHHHHQHRHHQQQQHHSHNPTNQIHSSSKSLHGKPTKRQSSVPIIVIPATNTSLINMYNAATILQDLNYTSGNTDKSRENEILIQRRKPDGSVAHYKIIDNPVRLDGEDWNRVVAVFVQGPAWQFKGWPWGGSPVEIFSRIKAFHLKWDEAKLDGNVAKWNVEVLELSRNKRHLDKAIFMKFWSSLDIFMVKYKSFLKF